MLAAVMEPEPDWARELFPDKPLMFVHDVERYRHYRHISGALFVICSARVEADGKRWIHVSCSRPSRLPDWDDMRLVKDTFIGRDRLALQILPRQAEYVNVCKNCLHLWSCLDGDPTPDFRVGGLI